MAAFRLVVLLAASVMPAYGLSEYIGRSLQSYAEEDMPEPRYMYQYDEDGKIVPKPAKEQHGKICHDECEGTGLCQYCGLGGACCQDGLGGLGCKDEGNPCGANAMCCNADTNLDTMGMPIPEFVCINGTVNGLTGANATTCNATFIDTVKQNYLVVAAILLLIILLLAYALSAPTAPKGATQMS